MKKKIYIASPLFSETEIRFNLELKKILSQYFEVFLPQENVGKIADLVKSGQSINDAGASVFAQDLDGMNQSDIILAVLDGRSVDEGTAFELGYMYSRSKECWGFQTDVRRPYITGNNPMIEFSCKKIFNSILELKTWAKEYH